MEVGGAPLAWRSANIIIVPLLKSKWDGKECRNYRGTSLLNKPGKVYGRVIIEKVSKITEMQIRDEQVWYLPSVVYARNIWRRKNKSLLYLGTWGKHMT
jgi:hypothetical protein